MVITMPVTTPSVLRGRTCCSTFDRVAQEVLAELPEGSRSPDPARALY